MPGMLRRFARSVRFNLSFLKIRSRVSLRPTMMSAVAMTTGASAEASATASGAGAVLGAALAASVAITLLGVAPVSAAAEGVVGAAGPVPGPVGAACCSRPAVSGAVVAACSEVRWHPARRQTALPRQANFTKAGLHERVIDYTCPLAN